MLKHLMRFESNGAYTYTGPMLSVHSTPEKSENTALFLRLGLPPTLVRYENGT